MNRSRWASAPGPLHAAARSTVRRLRAVLALAVGCLFLGVAAPGCGRDSDSDSTEPVAQRTEELGTILCGTYPGVDEQGRPTVQPEYYIVYSMNRKLKAFPEFAAAIGMQSVRTCDEARAFETAYHNYFQDHPYFDKTLQSNFNVKLPELPPEATGRAIVPKIYNGGRVGPSDPTNLYPVVHLNAYLPRLPDGGLPPWFNGQAIPGAGDMINGVISCSGTFIAKNFILTAGHCIAPIALQYDPTTTESQQWMTSALWEIDFPDSNGNVLHSSIDRFGNLNGGGTLAIQVWAYSVVNPNFSSVQNRFYPLPDGGPGTGSTVQTDPFNSPYDLALLYIPEVQYDGLLPADADKSAWDIQVDDIETNGQINNWALADYGYGPTDVQGTNAHVLNGSTAQPPNITTSTQFILGSVATMNPWPFFAICTGDSGGPLFRLLQTSNGTPPTFDTIIVGVNSSERGALCGVGVDSQGRPGASKWARVDIANSWIVSWVQVMRNTTLWSPVLLPDFNSPNSYMKLHGKSCQSDCDCKPNEFCDNPILNPSSPFSPQRHAQACASCLAPPTGDCGCAKGMCRPGPLDNINMCPGP